MTDLSTITTQQLVAELHRRAIEVPGAKVRSVSVQGSIVVLGWTGNPTADALHGAGTMLADRDYGEDADVRQRLATATAERDSLQRQAEALKAGLHIRGQQLRKLNGIPDEVEV